MTQPKIDSVRCYLQEIGRTPLLSSAEEIQLGNQVQQMIALSEKAKVTPEGRKILQQGQEAKKKMVEANLRLVVSVAKKYHNRGLSFQDLIQEGSLGLMRAVEKFDPSLGYKFSTYAYWWIRQSITRALAERSRTIRLPIHVTERLNQYKKAVRQLCLKLGRQPTESEIARQMEISLDKLRFLRRAAWRTKAGSLNLILDDNQTELGELLPDENSLSPKEFAQQQETESLVEAWLQELPSREREVISLRYGLQGGQAMSYRAIGQKFGISHQRVRQMSDRAMRTLRKKAAEMKELAV